MDMVAAGLNQQSRSLSSPVKVVHGANDGLFSVTGHTVGCIRASLKDGFNIPDEAAAFGNGVPVTNNYRLQAHDFLEFILPWGRKGSGDLPPEPPMTVKEAASLIGCSLSFVYKLLHNGEIAYERRGRRKLPIRQSVEEYRRRNIVQARPKTVVPHPPSGTRRYRHLFN